MLSKSTSTIGFIGLGNLGAPMARRLLNEGWNLRVHDTAVSKLAPFLALGATAAESREEVFAAEVLVLAVPDDVAVERLLEGPDGYFQRGPKHSLVAVHSTVLPRTAQRLAQAAAEGGVGFLDAPVSGGSDRAAEGDLTVYLGASTTDMKHADELLSSVASNINWVGVPGAAAAVKLANQVMLFSALGGVHEALALARGYGVNESAVLEAVSTSTGASWVTANWGFFDRTARAYVDGGTTVRDRPWSKDVFEALVAARAAEVAMPVTAVLSQTLVDYVEEHAGRPLS